MPVATNTAFGISEKWRLIFSVIMHSSQYVAVLRRILTFSIHTVTVPGRRFQYRKGDEFDEFQQTLPAAKDGVQLVQPLSLFYRVGNRGTTPYVSLVVLPLWAACRHGLEGQAGCFLTCSVITFGFLFALLVRPH